MKLLFIFLILLAACSQHSNFEQSAINRALSDPATAEEYFLNKIENSATIEEQAVYLYGMGVAHEEMGNDMEACNNYLSAEALGYEKANNAIQRIEASSKSQ